MFKVRLIFYILYFIFATSSALAQSEAQIRQQINQAASQMKSMQCDFVQTKHLKMLNDKMVARGKMYYRQGNQLRWEYVTPYAYTFILNNNKVLLKNSRRNDVIDVNQNKVFKEIARIMMNSVVGKCLADEKDFKTQITTVGQEWVATLQPLRKDMKQMFQQIILHFDRKQSVVAVVELLEKNGDRTVIELKDIRKNEPISSDLFTVD